MGKRLDMLGGFNLWVRSELADNGLGVHALLDSGDRFFQTVRSRQECEEAIAGRAATEDNATIDAGREVTKLEALIAEDQALGVKYE